MQITAVFYWCEFVFENVTYNQYQLVELSLRYKLIVVNLTVQISF
jgi:hypothetical protein